MSYEPTNWKTGDVVTSEKLNKLENGLKNVDGVLITTLVPNPSTGEVTLDKTWQEIHDADIAFIRSGEELDDGQCENVLYQIAYVMYVKSFDPPYRIACFSPASGGKIGSITFFASSANEYPKYTSDSDSVVLDASYPKIVNIETQNNRKSISDISWNGITSENFRGAIFKENGAIFGTDGSNDLTNIIYYTLSAAYEENDPIDENHRFVVALYDSYNGTLQYFYSSTSGGTLLTDEYSPEDDGGGNVSAQ